MIFKRPYRHISVKQAMEIMAQQDHIIVDVRSKEEYEEKHIPDAICIPLDTMDKPILLQDKKQTILVYCLTGRRARKAARKLAKLGYENVYEFGGIAFWPGETV